MEVFFLILLSIMFLFVVFLIVVAITGFPKKIYIKRLGREGEMLVAEELGENIENIQYTFNNYRIVYNQKSTEIDHIHICKNGVFVIETKNRSGDIYGEEDSQEWLQVLADGNVEHNFYNPIKQNNSHAYKISKILPSNVKVISIIVFISANLENINIKNVCNLSELRELIDSYPYNLNSKQINYCANILKNKEATYITDKQHIQSVKKSIKGDAK